MRNLLALILLMLVATGCGKSSAPSAHLAGTVTIGGQPVPADAEAALSFEPLDSGDSVSVQIIDSKYDCPNAPQGNVMVKFYISRRVGPKKVSERTGQEYQDVANLVPPQHAAGMQIEVSGDNTSQNFNL